MKTQLISFYLDFINTSLSCSDFAKSHNVSIEEALIFIEAGRKLNECNE